MQFIPIYKAEFSASKRQSSMSNDHSETIRIYWFGTK